MKIVLSGVLFLLIETCWADRSIKVTIPQGKLKGETKSTPAGSKYFSFQRIPYATPPIGDLRFKEPLPAKPWKGTLDATKQIGNCVQTDPIFAEYDVLGDEDCLYLNVYTTQISKELLPVIVFIHGGGLIGGSATAWGPEFLLDKPLVYVAMNYRLGPLGFLSTNDEVVPGNNGLKDQSLALHWVKDNIEHFGGDPKKITIYGQSAGGACVYYHLLSPLSRDIPYAAITSSGTSPSLWSIAQKGETETNIKRFAQSFNCSTTSSESLIECLRDIPAGTLVKQTLKFTVYSYEPNKLFKPVVEPDLKGAFLSKHPMEIIKCREVAQVPLMTGIVTEDGSMKSAGIYNDYQLVDTLDKGFNNILPLILSYDQVNFDTNDTSDSIRKFYFQERNIDNDTKSELTNLVTDSFFYTPFRIVSLLHAKYSSKPVYAYLFGYKGSNTYSKGYGDPDHDYGVSHCDDLLYLLPNPSFNPVLNPEDTKMKEFMTNLWYNFISTGNPTGDSNLTKWDPVVSNDLEYFYIKNNLTEMRKNFNDERFMFWRNMTITKTLYNVETTC